MNTNMPAATRETRSFQPDELIAVLENANIPWKRSGGEIEADFDGTGHLSHKINPQKGCWLNSFGESGTVASLLWQHKLRADGTPMEAARPRPQRIPAPKKPSAVDTSRIARKIWESAWTCTHENDMPSGWDRGLSGGILDMRRNVLEEERRAVIQYLRERLGEHWLHWLRQVRIARDRDKSILMLLPMQKNGVVVGVQRVFLTPDGKKIERKMLGKIGVYPLPAPTGVLPVKLTEQPPLLVGEGWETVASVVQACGQPGVATFSANGLVRWADEQAEAAQKSGKAPNRSAIILVDRDESQTGQKASAKAISALRNSGVTALYAMPPAPEAGGPRGGEKGSDWADYVREQIDGALVAHLQMAIARGDSEMPDLPDEPPAPVTVPFDMAGFRQAENPEAPAPSQDVDDVRRDMQTHLQKIVDEYSGEWLRQNKDTRSPFPPALFRITTGVGKSHALKKLPRSVEVRKVDGRVVVSVQTHEQAREYEAAGYTHFWGRQPDENGPAPQAWCPNHDQLTIAMEKEHVSQSEVCRTCTYGLKWAIDDARAILDAGNPSPDRARKLKKKISDHLHTLSSRGLDPESVTPCRWQSHLQEVKRSQFVVMTHNSYSHSVVGDAILFCDESFSLGKTVEIELSDVHSWAARNADILERLRGELDGIEQGEQTERAQELHDKIGKHGSAAEFFRVLATRMAEWTGQGKDGAVSVDAALADAIRGLVDSVSHIELAAWEKLTFDRLGNIDGAPLRAAFAMADSLRFVDGGHVHHGRLVVSAPSQIVDRIRLGFPTILMDATPPAALADIVRANGGQIVDLIARQNVRIVKHPQRFWGLSALDPKRVGPDRVEKETEKRHILRSIYPDARILDHKRAFDQLDSGVVDGYWGRDHRAHNEWSGQDLTILGSFFPPEGAWRSLYQADRLAALIGGCSAEDWPAWPENSAPVEGHWVCEGSADVQSRLPLPADPRIKAWLLDRITSETVQAVGRTRGANSEREIAVHIYGGVPLAGLGQHGLEISEYRNDPQELGQSRDEVNQERHEAAMNIRDAAAGRLAARGETITRESVDKELFLMYREGLYCHGKERHTKAIQTQTSPYTYQQWLDRIQEHAPSLFAHMSKTGRGAPTVRAILATAERYGRQVAQMAVAIVDSFVNHGVEAAWDALDMMDAFDGPRLDGLEQTLSIVLTGDDGPPVDLIA